MKTRPNTTGARSRGRRGQGHSMNSDWEKPIRCLKEKRRAPWFSANHTPLGRPTRKSTRASQDLRPRVVTDNRSHTGRRSRPRAAQQRRAGAEGDRF